MTAKDWFIDFRKRKFPAWGVPLALLFACVMAFGIFIPWLGFYQDDWHFVYNAYARGPESMWPLLYTDGRPLAAWPYVLGFNILGFAPFAWHLLALILRYLTAICFWLMLRQLWPKNNLRNFAIVLLFVIHPFFTLQPLSVAYAPHWTAFLFFSFSMFAMVKAVKQRDRFWLWFPLSVTAATIHIFTIEYFAGLEIVRPMVLWLALEGNQSDFRRKLFWRAWAIYLSIFALFVVWRAWIFDGPRASMPGIEAFLSDPLATLLHNVQVIWADIVLILVSAWSRTLEARFFDFSDIGTFYAFVLGVIMVALSFGFLTYSIRKWKLNERPAWHTLAFLLGLLWMIGGLIPAYAIGETIYLQNPLWNSRLALAALPGASILTWVIIDRMFTELKIKVIVLSVLVGLSISFHAYIENEFRWAWNEQLDLYHQLTLRVPDIEPNTAIIAEQEILSYMGDYPTAYALKLLYASSGVGQSRVPIWFFAVSANFPENEDGLFKGIDLRADQFLSSFRGNSRDALYISFSRQLSSCVWVLGPESQDLKNTSSFIRKAGLVSDLRRIDANPGGISVLNDLIGPAEKDWCFFYEKAELARQFGDWKRIAYLWDEASTMSLNPGHGFEFLPFVDAFAHLGDWDMANQLTKRANQITNGVDQVYCSLWSDLSQITPSSSEARQSVRDFCETN